MEADIAISSTNARNFSAQLPTKFLQCKRCEGFILSETSTAKRIHNVKCLSSAVDTMKLLEGANCSIFQGFLQKQFPGVTVNLPKLNAERMGRGIGRVLLENQRKVSDKEDSPKLEDLANATSQVQFENQDINKRSPGSPLKLDTRKDLTLGSSRYKTENTIPGKRSPGRPRKCENLTPSSSGYKTENKIIIGKRSPDRPRKIPGANEDKPKDKRTKDKRGRRRPHKLSTENLTLIRKNITTNKSLIGERTRGRPRKVILFDTAHRNTLENNFLIGKKRRGRHLGVKPNKNIYENSDQDDSKSNISNETSRIGCEGTTTTKEVFEMNLNSENSKLYRKNGTTSDQLSYSRSGVDVANIVQDKLKCRNSYLKAKVKFKEILDKDVSDESDNEIETSATPKSARKRRSTHHDEDFTVSDDERVNFRSHKVQSKINQSINETKLAEEMAKTECTKCGRFIQRRGMKRHLALHEISKTTTRQHPKTIMCILCSKYLSSPSNLKVHFMASHMETTPFACRFAGCNYKGGEYYHLERHVGTHMRENKIKCKECKKTFTKFESVIRHKLVCKGTNKFKSSLKNRRRIKRTKLVNVSTDLPVVSNNTVERDRIVQMESIHLYDKIIETDEGPIHVKGEHLEAFPETYNYTNKGYGSNANLKTETVTVENNYTNNKTNLVEESDQSQETDDECEWDEAKIREAITKIILSWNDKLQDNGYINSVLEQDPLFQKLQKENTEFASMILKDGGRKKYFSVHKTSTKFNYRCEVCSKAFRRSWALLKHKQENVCSFLKHTSSNTNNNSKEAVLKENSTVANDDNNHSTSDLSFMCSGCGFQSNSAKELEVHLKTSSVHSRELLNRNKPFKCPKSCGSAFETIKQLNNHIDELHFKLRKVKCPHCPRHFVNLKRMKQHVYNYHTRRAIFSCSKCGNKFRVKKSCEEHESKCKIEIRRPKCQQCNEHFSDVNSLRRHIKVVHLHHLIAENKEMSNRAATDSTLAINEPTTVNDNDSMILGI